MNSVPQATPPSRFVRLARLCNRHRWRTFFVWVLAVVVLQVLSASVGVKEISSFRLPGTESQRAYDLLAQHFPAAKGDTDQLVFEAKSGTLKDSRAKIDAALKRVGEAPNVARVQSPFAKGGQLTKDAKIGVASLSYKQSTNDIDAKALQKIEKAGFAARSSTVRVEHGGPGAEKVRFSNTSMSSESIGLLAAAVVLLITFGSAVAAGIPLLAAILAISGTLGLITLISHLVDTPDFATQLASLIGIGVGIDYALFVVTRFRAEVFAGRDREEAIDVAVDTAGRTVLFAASTVVIALLGLLLLGLSFMHGVALGAASAVLATMFAALTLLPALIGGSKGYIDGVLVETDRRGGFRFSFTERRFALPLADWRRRRSEKRLAKQSGGHAWARWSEGVQKRPLLAAGVAIVLLLALAYPALNLRLGSSDAGVDPPGTTTRAAYDLISKGFGPGINGSFLIVADLGKKDDKAGAAKIAAAVKGDRDFALVAPPAISPDGAIATITAFPKTGPQDARTTATLDRLRSDVVPAAEQASGAKIEVGGFTASGEDFSSVVAGKLPLFVAVVVLLSALLLLVVFRSVIIPIKAAVMNLLSIGAALGFVTLIFQEGHGGGLLGIGTGPIESFVPVLMFAIVFGLSMDYEVFLISRVHEEWEKSGDASGAVVRGLATTGRVITAAASIMVVVFASFALGDDRIIKLFGIGLASAVFFDAVIIRCLLVPALMELFGERAWWLPSWLERRLPRLAIEGGRDDAPAPRPEPVLEGA